MYEGLVKALRLCVKYNKATDALMNAGEAADAIEELICEVADEHNARMAAEGKPRWIPVTERLPEKFQPIWVACKMEGRENWTFDTVYDPYLKCPWGPYYYLEKGEAVVYAWMDRSDPEPPMEEA